MKDNSFYIASPFFNEKQLKTVEKIEDMLNLHVISFYSPMREGVLEEDASQEERDRIYNSNINAIDNSSYMIVVTDGKDVGTIFEAGYGYAIGAEIIYCMFEYNGPFNIMLAKSGVAVIRSLDELSMFLDANEDEIDKGDKLHWSSYEGKIQ